MIAHPLNDLPKHAKETIRGRLVEIMCPYLQGERASLAKFADECAHRRNDLSHHGGPRSNGEQAYETFLRQLMALCGALSILYHAALLQKIRVDDKTLLVPLECNPVRSRLRPLLPQAGLNLPALEEPAKQVLPTEN
jgi:hypothetical protein